MFCCNRLTPLEFGETYTLRDQDIQKHGIDVEEKTSSLPVYGDSKFKIELVVVTRISVKSLPSRWQRIREHFSLLSRPLEPGRLLYSITDGWKVTRVRKS